MGPQRIVRNQSGSDEIRAIRLHALVHMLAEVAVGPAIKPAVLHRSDVVGHEVAPDLVTLIDGDPKVFALGLPIHAVWIAQSRREQACRISRSINFPDGGATFFDVAVFSVIAVGAHGDVELCAVATCDDVLRPMMVETRRQGNDLDATRSNGGCAFTVQKPYE